MMFNPALFATHNYLSRRDNNDCCEEFSDEIGRMSGRCLDIGSGPGDMVIDLVLPKLNPNATLVCSDISEPMVNYGKEKYKNNERTSFIKLDIESPNLPQDLVQRFDHVLSFYCIHWCQDMRQVFKNIMDLLQPGGTALFTFLFDFPSSEAYKPLATIPRYQPYMQDVDRYIHIFRHAERPLVSLKELLKDVGFEVQHCSIREKSHIYDNPDAMGDFMLSVNPFIERIPIKLKTQFKNDLVEEIVRRSTVIGQNIYNETDYRTLIKYHTFIVYLKKPLNLN